MEVFGIIDNGVWAFLAILFWGWLKWFMWNKERKGDSVVSEAVNHIEMELIKLAAEFNTSLVFIIQHYEKHYSIEYEYVTNGFKSIKEDYGKHEYDDFSNWAISILKKERAIILHRRDDCDSVILRELMQYYEMKSYYAFGLFKDEKLEGSLNCYFSKENAMKPKDLAAMVTKASKISHML